MALLWQAGVRDTALDVVAAWKDVLLLAAVVLALAAAGSIPHLGWPDRLALAYGAFVVVYWLLPQSWLDGDATARGELYALRHHLLPLGAYILGRLVALDRAWWRRIVAHPRRCRRRARGLGARRRLPRAAPVVARLRGARLVPRAARARLSLPLGPARELDPEHGRGEPRPPARLDLPEPARDRVRARRRAAPARRRAAAVVDGRRRRDRVRGAPLDAHARRVHRAARRPRSCSPLCGVAWRAGRARGRLGRRDGRLRRRCSRRSGRRRPTPRRSSSACARTPPRTASPATTRSSTGESSTSSHLSALRDGIRTVARHPWGYGLGNAGVSAARTGVTPKAGESTYTELGVEHGPRSASRRSSAGSSRSSSHPPALSRGSQRRSRPSRCSGCRPT